MSREAMKTAHDELAALIPAPLKPQVDDWPCSNPADRECLQRAYTALRAALSEPQPVAWMNPAANVFAQHKEGADNFGCTVPLYAHPAAPPEGYVLVPVEPTEEMVLEGRRALRDNGAEGSDFELQDDAAVCYKAMLSAAKGGA